jgi:hypothetical protein
MKVLQQARFANASFAYDQRYLAFAVEHTFPSIQQQPQFFLATDERGKTASCCNRFEPATHSAWPDYPVDLERPVGALQGLRSKILDHEQPRDQPMGSRGNEYCAGSRKRLNTCSIIRSLAKDIRILAGTCANDHPAGVDADSYGELPPG